MNRNIFIIIITIEWGRLYCIDTSLSQHLINDTKHNTVVPVMNGHPRDQAILSVHCRLPLVTGTDGQAGDAKYNIPCNTT